MRLNLFDLLRELTTFLNPLHVREIILAASGFKVSRTCLEPALADRLSSVADRFGFSVVASERRIVHRKDVGKGGWANRVQAVLPVDAEDGDLEVYLARDGATARQALDAERREDDEAFGQLLGIPPCCRAAYLGFAPVAARKQNDFVPLVAAATAWPPPFDPATNYVAQYFGLSLLSHFPCSFRCQATRDLATRAYDLLAAHDPAFADRMWQAQHVNILYTEYCGILAFADTRTELDRDYAVLTYRPEGVRSTAPSPVVDAVRAGDRLRACACDEIEVCRGDLAIARLLGEDFALCLFR